MSIDGETDVMVCGCGNTCFQPQPCAYCEWERDEMHHYTGLRRPEELLCSDCRTQCKSCKDWTCENHMRGPDCLKCAGPSDAEMRAAGMIW